MKLDPPTGDRHEPRLATLAEDGWTLLSAEARHAESPSTFWIPPSAERKSLRVGQAAKLLFCIESVDQEESLDRAVERMWVIVVRLTGEGYVGILENQPNSILPDRNLAPGIEVFFRPEHVADIDSPPGDYLARKYGDRL